MYPCHARRNVMPVNYGSTSSASRNRASTAGPLGPLEGDEPKMSLHTDNIPVLSSRKPLTVYGSHRQCAGSERTAHNRFGKLSPFRAVRELYKLAAHRGALSPHAIFECRCSNGVYINCIFSVVLYIFVHILFSLYFSIFLHLVSVAMLACVSI